MMHSTISARTLGVVRTWVFGIWLCIILFDDFSGLGALPVELFEPYGVLALIPHDVWAVVITPPGLLALKLLLILFLITAALGMRPYHVVATGAVVLLTVHQGLVRGFGFINHAELAILYAAYILAWAPAGDGFRVGVREELKSTPAVRSLAMVLITLIPLLAYSAIALFRLANSAPEIFTGDSMLHYIGRSTFRGSYYGMAWGEELFKHPEFMGLVNAGFVVVTIFEVLSPFCLFSRRFRMAWLGVIVPFHFSTLFLMNIFFWENLLLFMVTLVDIEKIVCRVTKADLFTAWVTRLSTRRYA